MHRPRARCRLRQTAPKQTLISTWPNPPVDPASYALSRGLRTVFKIQTQREFRSASVISAQAASVGSKTAERIGGAPRIAEAKIAPAQRTAFETISMRFIVCSVVDVAFAGMISK